jgi:hypothetical protein
MCSTEVYFGGPDCARGRLRDVLAQRVSQVPAGGAIDWVTYYFRDRRLAEDLLAARRRGVTVRVTLEGRPRTPHANDRVVRMLGGPDGLGEGFRLIGRATDSKYQALWRPRLHEKLYCFSHPEPAAFIGSFNPSGDDPEDSPAVIREIGDQDRGHNLLVELRDRRLVTGSCGIADSSRGCWSTRATSTPRPTVPSSASHGAPTVRCEAGSSSSTSGPA